MNRHLILMLLLLSLTGVILAQDKDDEDEPLPPPRKASATKFGGAAGYTQNLLFLNIDPINQALKSANAAPFDGNGLFMTGGQGYGYIMFLPNVRIGGMGASGTRTSTSIQGTTVRTTELSAGYGGVTIDYVMPVLPRLDVTAGLLLGAGGLSLTMTRDEGVPKVWDSVLTQLGGTGSASQYTAKMSGAFFVYQPSVNVEVALLRWIGIRVGASYMGLVGSDWKFNDRYDLAGVPDNINSKGWMINGGIFIGTFMY
ncbi:MAG TPA: hypothetical protein VMW43_04385 [Bacteroidota bacterium]|nr:hypothetical protein [Bacteroidota bacterium]